MSIDKQSNTLFLQDLGPSWKSVEPFAMFPNNLRVHKTFVSQFRTLVVLLVMLPDSRDCTVVGYHVPEEASTSRYENMVDNKSRINKSIWVL